MKRREFISLLGGAAAWPLSARAQLSERVPRVGVLFAPYKQAWKASAVRVAAFGDALHGLGWDDNRNIRIDYHWGEGNIELVKTYATELVQSAPDAIVAADDLALAQLQRLTSTIPIVFTQVSEPVDSGFVASLARPGGNITGFQNFEPAMGGKWLGVLKEVAPNLKRVGALVSSDEAPQLQFLRAAETVAPSLGVTVAAVDIQSKVEPAIVSYADHPDSGLIVFPHRMAYANRAVIHSLAARYRLPTIYPYRFMILNDGLIAYGPDQNQIEQWRGAATYIDRILKGEKPADLPVQAPSKYELVINLKAAKALDLTIPPSVLAHADEVIE
jgi:putative ABC transport system substrate-binding protein